MSTTGQPHLLPLELLFIYLREEARVEIALKKRATKLRGVLMGIDEHMNLTIRDAEEVRADGSTRALGEIMLRGDNILSVSSSLSVFV